jgi:hypothetical protein
MATKRIAGLPKLAPPPPPPLPTASDSVPGREYSGSNRRSRDDEEEE